MLFTFLCGDTIGNVHFKKTNLRTHIPFFLIAFLCWDYLSGRIDEGLFRLYLHYPRAPPLDTLVNTLHYAELADKDIAIR